MSVQENEMIDVMFTYERSVQAGTVSLVRHYRLSIYLLDSIWQLF